MTIKITSTYGFDHNWTLTAYGRDFYLGQDSKFCNRVLGLSPAKVVEAIGTNRLDTEHGLKVLAEYICKRLGVTAESVNELNDWDLCAQ